jgi:hypothetical protein
MQRPTVAIIYASVDLYLLGFGIDRHGNLSREIPVEFTLRAFD